MDNINFPGTTVSDTPLSLNAATIAYLNETRRWAKFLAIMGFIGVGLLVLLALFIGSALNLLSSFSPTPFPFPTFLFTIIYLLIALLYFFPILYLYRFSAKLGIALSQKNEIVLAESFSNLKSLFKFMGIMTIVVLSFYFLAFICFVIVAMFLRH